MAKHTKSYKINWKQIDKKIRPLIKELNKVGLKTMYSCAGHIGKDRIFRPYVMINFKGKEISVRGNKLCIYWDWRR